MTAIRANRAFRLQTFVSLVYFVVIIPRLPELLVSAACTVPERENSAVDPVGDEPRKTRITRNEDNRLRAGSPLGTAAIWATPSDFRVIRVFRGYVPGTISKDLGGMHCSGTRDFSSRSGRR